MNSPEAAASTELAAAYKHCREIARREAKNFFYAFRVLPKAKSDAMCAVYAFMRKADDLADDEALPIEARREAMAAWTAAWHHAQTARTDDPVFLAVSDTQRRFAIPSELLDQLLAGTTMDLQLRIDGVAEVSVAPTVGSRSETYQVYETFEDLYRYCYLVASVVGLVCIRIFGYTDPKAENLAERTGVAFQLTNILRDVREDTERGRMYLPLDLSAAAGVSVQQLASAARKGESTPAVLALLEGEVARARDFYRSADELIPLLSPDSRAAMRVLSTIYRELLERIATDPSAVLRGRVSLPTSRKVGIVLRALLSSALPWTSK